MTASAELAGQGATSALAAPASLLAGVDAAVCQAFKIQSLRRRSAALDLCGRENLPTGAVAAAFEQIAANWHACRGSRPASRSTQNWRWRVPQLAIAAHNGSPEVLLERGLVAACERLGRVDWANQVPVASGVAGSSAERRRAIDLVREVSPGHFELIELKIASDTPLYAAVEIIGYACIWLLSRVERGEAASPLLQAGHIDAVVLAPERYYARYRLSALESLLDTELTALGAAHGVELRFRFESFPDDLGRPPFSDERHAALLDARRQLEP